MIGPWRFLMVLVAAATLMVATGCGVRSKMIVTSDPPGADITMNGVRLGKTPVEHPFTWYWYYDFIAEKEGYERTGARERFRAPVYLWPGIDMAMELMPFYVKDTQRVHLTLAEADERPEPVLAATPDVAARPTGDGSPD